MARAKENALDFCSLAVLFQRAYFDCFLPRLPLGEGWGGVGLVCVANRLSVLWRDGEGGSPAGRQAQASLMSRDRLISRVTAWKMLLIGALPPFLILLTA